MHEPFESPDRLAGTSAFMPALEKWIAQIIAANAGKDERQVVRLVRDKFKILMQASIDYHDEYAEAMDAEGSAAIAKYHRILADSYQAISKKRELAGQAAQAQLG